jgi:hypothetical protein
MGSEILASVLGNFVQQLHSLCTLFSASGLQPISWELKDNKTAVMLVPNSMKDNGLFCWYTTNNI